MSATAVILLIGVVSFWAGIAVLGVFLLRLRKTLESMESTLKAVEINVNELTPAMTDTLREMEKTGREVGHTAAEVRVLAGKVNAGSAPKVISGAVNYLPAVAGAVRLIVPLFKRGRR
ncbi:hypothetical protein CSA37_04795 [Candidatus Fermentibacteria bacterium]|nr:MAG: hypothetical protein CSA37_04795 [Candidatus Fermentibacteria bacterium]